MTVSLMPAPRLRFFTNSGAPAAGFLLYTFDAGTSKPRLTWQDSAGQVPHENPIRLDGKGEALVYFDGNYKLDLRDQASGATVTGWPVDNFATSDAVAVANNGIAALTAALLAPDGAHMVGFTQAGANAIHQTMQDKGREHIGPQDFTGSADAQHAEALAAIGQQPRTLHLGGRTVTLSAAPVNTFGVPVNDGKVLVPSLIPGQKTQLNSYAPDINGLMVGRENLAYFWKFATLPTPFNVYFYGDSTVELGPGWPLKSHDLFQMALQDAGVNNSRVINRGSSGTAWSNLNAIPDLGSSTYLIVIKYGINDAVKADPLATMAAAMRAKLAAIRGAPWGGITQLSILLMGPNSTYSPTAGQDAKWYEDVRKVYVQVAQEFDCAYFDTYAYLQQTRRAPNFWMDDLGSLGKPGEGLHPDQFAVHWIYRAAVKDHILGDGGWNNKKANNFWNLSNYTKPALASDTPATYQRGVVMQLAMVANGFPLDGVLRTEAFADGSVVQTISTTDVVPRTASRRGTDFVWAQWAGVPVLVTEFSNGWAAKGAGYAPPGYQVQADGFVELFGHISGGTLNSVAFTLPGGTWPALGHVFLAATNAKVNVFSNGQVTVDTADNTMVALGGIRFRVL